MAKFIAVDDADGLLHVLDQGATKLSCDDLFVQAANHGAVRCLRALIPRITVIDQAEIARMADRGAQLNAGARTSKLITTVFNLGAVDILELMIAQHKIDVYSAYTSGSWYGMKKNSENCDRVYRMLVPLLRPPVPAFAALNVFPPVAYSAELTQQLLDAGFEPTMLNLCQVIDQPGFEVLNQHVEFNLAYYVASVFGVRVKRLIERYPECIHTRYDGHTALWYARNNREVFLRDERVAAELDGGRRARRITA